MRDPGPDAREDIIGRPATSNLVGGDAGWWAAYGDTLERAARDA
ncbi:hypothetical protein [Dactylosporangium sp. NPDC051484]